MDAASLPAPSDAARVELASVEQPAPSAPAPVEQQPVEQQQPVEHPASDETPAAPAPPVTNDPPAPAPAPSEPTPEQPLTLDCYSASDCAACAARIELEHPEWVDSGAAQCLLRECADALDCEDLASGLVCRPYVEGGSPVCRAPRIEAGHICPINELLTAQPVSPCELGLACQPYGGALRCRPI